MSPPATTLERLQTIIARDFEVDPHLLKSDTHLKDCAIDSLAVIEIMFAVEEEFGIVIPAAPPGESGSIDTLDDLVRYVDRLVSEQHGASRAGEALP